MDSFCCSEEEIEDVLIDIKLDIIMDELITIQGQPKSKINLGSKVILQYESLKFIFVDDKLVEVE